MTITNIDTMRPHIVIQGKIAVHVCPVLMFDNIISGKLKTKDIEGLDDILPMIIDEWLDDQLRCF